MTIESNLQNMILWSDPNLLVVNKPAGLLTLPDGYHPDLPHLRGVLESSQGRLWIVHRLDKETSGVILLARNAETHRFLNTQFQEKRVVKIYHALVAGNPDWDMITVDKPLRTNVGSRHRTVIDEIQGKSAVTMLRVLQRFNHPELGEYSLMEAQPKTGRTHQVRVHLYAVGFPIIADPLYGNLSHPAHRRLISLGLLARAITFPYPSAGSEENRWLTFEAPYPAGWCE